MANKKQVEWKHVKIMLWILGVVFIWAVLTGGQEPPKPKASTTSQELRVVQAQRIVRGQLVDPPSATFLSTHYTDRAVCGMVRAKNQLGGFTIERFIYTGGRPMMEGEAGFDATWQRNC